MQVKWKIRVQLIFISISVVCSTLSWVGTFTALHYKHRMIVLMQDQLANQTVAMVNASQTLDRQRLLITALTASCRRDRGSF